MSNIDDIFKEGLKNAGMPYADSHWSAMEKQLPVKTAWPWWKLMAGGMGVVAIATLFLFSIDSKETLNDLKNEQVKSVQEQIASNPTAQNKSKENVVDLNKELSAKPNNEVVIPEELITDADNKNSVIGRSPFADIKSNEVSSVDVSSSDILVISDQARDQNLSLDIARGDKLADKTTDKTENLIDYNDLIGDRKVSLSPKRFTSDFGITHSIPSNQLQKIKGLRLKYIPQWQWSISPFAEMSGFSVQNNIDGSISDELGNLSNAEEITGVNYGLKVAMQKGNWSFYSGIMSNQQKERTNYKETATYFEYETALRIVNSSYGTTPRGTKIVLVEEQKIDSTLVSQSIPICSDCEVQFNYVSVPVGFTYSLGTGRLSYFAEVEGLYSRLIGQTGEYALVNETTQSVEVRELEAEDVSANLFSGALSAGVDLKLIPRVSVWSSVGIRQSLNSVLNSHNQQTRVYPVRLGIKVKL